MKNERKERDYDFEYSTSESGAKPGRVGCYRARLEELEEQIPIECFDECDMSVAREIHRIIAEMSILPEECDVQIDGVKLPAAVVADVYRSLTVEHVKGVIENFEQMAERIRFRKSYLRTALYNAALEYSSGMMNQARAWGFAPNKRIF